ncbi:MAG: 23S rRNA (adenine(2503)-C(2))-methyltransferase RlmN [Myxococcota bacterium]
MSSAPEPHIASNAATPASAPTGPPLRPALKDYDLPGLEAVFTARGIAPFRARQIFRWLYIKSAANFGEMTDLSRPFRESLSEEWDLRVLEERKTALSEDGTQKWVFALRDGTLIETVLIPEVRRNTICISTQVGCAMKCSFCLTGTEGFVRNLTVAEILDQICQVRIARRDVQVTNVVLMGMGEPLLNYDAVIRAIRVMSDPLGFGLSSRRITLSTVGILPKLRQLLEDVKVSIAISLHSPTNGIRDRLVPLNARYPVEAIVDACRALPLPSRRNITFEYTLIEGVNDSPEEADRLCRLLRGLPAKVNLIPLNENPGIPYRRPGKARIEAFQTRLWKQGVHVVRRATRGVDISAACGQLKGRR